MSEKKSEAILKTVLLGDALKDIIVKLPPDNVTLPEIRDILGQDGLLMLTGFLTLVFLIPVSIPGVSTLFGTGILLISICRLINRNLWLPKYLHKKQVPTESLRNSLKKGIIWFQRLERLSSPKRLRLFTDNKFTNYLNNFAMILGALLLMAPFGLVPFSNTLPAIALLLFAIGLLQRDGLSVLFGHITNVVTIVYFSLIITGSGTVLKKLYLWI